MKKFIQTIFVTALITGFIFGRPRPMLKSEIRMTKMIKPEPDYRRGEASRYDCPHVYPNNPGSMLTVIDSSSNGYGMWATVTRPMNVMSDGNMLVVYRQFAGENTTHGQLGAGYGVVDEGQIQWDVQYNVNYNGNPPWGGGGVGGCGSAQARYPSSLASEEYPYAIYNEYTGGPPTCPAWPSECSDYGGRPYFSYDEFGWGGESWVYPWDLDPLYDCTKDLWQGSVGYGYDNTSGDHHVSVVYDDWTRGGSYLFTSEAVIDGYIILGTETLIVNPQHQGTENYSSSAILSFNDNGQGILGLDGIFAGSEPDAGPCGSVCNAPASNLTCNKVPMFKVTDDFGESWTGNHAAFDFYYVPDAVFDDIFSTWPNTVVTDACTGAQEDLCGYWSWYEFDMRVDNEGNPHIVVSLLGETLNAFPTIPGKTGFYHLTIDRNMLGNNHDDNPEWVNTPQGWNWSYIPLPANDSFDWNRPDGSTGYLFGAMCQISLSRDNPDIVYMVANIAETGPMSSEHDANGDGIEDDLCGEQDWPWELYPEWSEDIWVAKSMDNGSTWTALENLTQTPRVIEGNELLNQHCSPEEQLVHTAHWSEDERVYYQFHQPNWGWNEIGDALGADHMNRVWLGYSWVTETGAGGCMDTNNCSYDEDAAFDDGSCGVGTYTGSGDCLDGESGCGCAGECADGLEPPTIIDCNDVCNGGAFMLCNSIGSGGGEYCASAETNVCSETSFNDDVCGDGDEEYINDWHDCNSDHCGTVDPLFTCDGMITWNGGRCYTCWNGDNEDTSVDTQGDCVAQGYQWKVRTEQDIDDLDGDGITDEMCDDSEYGCLDYYDNYNVSDCPTYNADCENNIPGDSQDPDDCLNDGWVPFISDGDDENGEETGGSANECSCTASYAASNAEKTCPTSGNMNGDISDGDDGEPNTGDAGEGEDIFNLLDVIMLANCILADNCANLEYACAADIDGDGEYSIFDIIQLANCALADNCGGRVDDANESRLIIENNVASIEADGFIGGVEMTLIHGSDFRIEMTRHAMYADYLTNSNETRLLVINPETDDLFSYNGDFEITNIIVANSQHEVSVDMPIAAEISLSDAYPNPFNPTTTMVLTMPVSGDMHVEVYNLLGQVVTTLVSGYKEAGIYNLTWDATDVSSGMYFVKVQADGFTKIQKLMLVK